MKNILLTGLFICQAIFVNAQAIKDYRSLDPKWPIVFGGSYIVYANDTIQLGPNAFFIDGQLRNDIDQQYPYVFNSINKAATKLTDGTEDRPMTLYIAPSVYWIDNPDDTAIRIGENGQPPYGLVVKCEWLKFYGLNPNPVNVVLACNRGQTIGAKGNFTMFRFIGQGTSSENITFGNYCNVDLVYPLKPAFNRKKRASAIVQAQLIHCNGDKIVARNTRFVSRLNLCPFVGAKRALFDRCHFESTDDALCGTGVYLHCDFDVYGSKPFYRTIGTGAVFLDCLIKSHTSGRQFFTKANGQLAVIDTRIQTNPGTYIGWNDDMPAEARNYQFNVTQNGQPVFIGRNDPASTVDLTGKKLLQAYRFTQQGKPVYNTYNLLKGDDNWDPMQVRNKVIAASKTQQADYTDIPTQVLISPKKIEIETNKDEAVLTASVMRFGNYPYNGGTLHWSVAKGNEGIVKLVPAEDGRSCKIIPNNFNNEAKEIVVTATSPIGLEAAAVVTVKPPILPAPSFSNKPALSFQNNGTIQLSYKLNSQFKDQSDVKWYRCTDIHASNAIEVAVSTPDAALLTYTLSAGDIGYYIMAAVAAKHIRSQAADTIQVIAQRPVTAKDVQSNNKILTTDFKNISIKNQPLALPGFWTWKHLIVPGNEQKFITDTTKDAWKFDEGIDGAAGMKGLIQGRSADMRYTPVGDSFEDMKLKMVVAPFKTAGQGFSVAPLYMDVLIKLDTKTLTGYALRFIRTTKHHDAVDCMFVQYDNGNITAISEPVSTSAFRSLCTIEMETHGNRLEARVTTSADKRTSENGVLPSVNIGTTIAPVAFGGFGIQYNGGSPTMIKTLQVAWE